MRLNIISVVILGLILMFPIRWSHAQEKQIVLRVDGLACPFCAYGLEKKLMSIPGVISYDADLEKGEVYLVVKNGDSVNIALLKRIVKESGYTLRKVILTSDEESEEHNISEESQE